MQPQHKVRRVASVLLLAVTMLLALTVFTTPEASAHAGKFEHDDLFLASACPASHMPNGQQSGGLIGCTPIGYVPIGNDAALCAEANGFFQSGWCTFDGARACGSSVAFAQPVGGGDCVRPALVLASFLPAISGDELGAIPVCIERKVVQDNAEGLRVSNTFWDDGRRYLITSSETTCNFNCEDGWDINCDGKLGDFCPIEYDLYTVTDVGKCLARFDILIY